MNDNAQNQPELAVVTGAGSGIGRAIALALAAEGKQVVAADLNLQAAEETAAQNPQHLAALAVDVSDPDQVTALHDQVQARFGNTSILINAAGWDRMAQFLETDFAFAQKVVAINYLGPVYMSRVFLPDMVELGRGRIVNLASDAGRVGSSGETIYAGAKGGVIALTKSLAREMARHTISVNCVCPGPTDTPLLRSFPDKLQAALARAIPFKRVAQPEEVAAAAVFFASPQAAYITGQVLSVSGGLTMAG